LNGNAALGRSRRPVLKRLLTLAGKLALPSLPAGVKSSLAMSPIIMFGPMVHFNIGNHDFHTSYAFEASYWNVAGLLPYSLDLGIEVGRRHVRIYSEGQTGIALAGFSIGPVLEKASGKPMALGLQTSLWANYFAGADFRWRFVNGGTYYCPGLYLKIPPLTGDADEIHHHHHFDWDD
jgi:hypothetical protein